MSQENVEIVRAFPAAWNARDMDAVRDLLHPDTIMRVIDGVTEHQEHCRDHAEALEAVGLSQQDAHTKGS